MCEVICEICEVIMLVLWVCFIDYVVGDNKIIKNLFCVFLDLEGIVMVIC